MKELYYVPSTKVNAKVSDFIIPGTHITMEGLTYQHLSKKPKGRSIKRRMLNTVTNEKLIIY